MEHPTVNLVLLVVLCVTATLPWPTMGQAEGTSTSDEDFTTASTTIKGQDSHCLHDLINAQFRKEIDTRLKERDSPLNQLDARLTNQDTRVKDLGSRQTEINTRLNGMDTRFNRMDSRLDGMETAIADMKAFLQQRWESMDRKVELVLAETRTRQEENTQNQNEYIDCQDALNKGQTMSGVYTISPDRNSSMSVYCEQSLSGGGWTVFQARYNGRVDFAREWQAYKTGFGDLHGEFWLGNDHLHQLTKHRDQQLKIELVSPDGEVQYANYSRFYVADEGDKYRLTVTGYSGGTPPGDSMASHNGQLFSTLDQDNDEWSGSCAQDKHAGWWYKRCQDCNLNGKYGGTVRYEGVNWYKWKGYSVSMKATRMMVRKRR